MGWQQAQCPAGVYYEPVNNSVLDGSLKELIYPGLFSNVGYEAQLWLCQAELLLPHCPKILPFSLTSSSRVCGVGRSSKDGLVPTGFLGHPLLCDTQALAGTCSIPSPPAHHSCNEAPAKPRGLAQGLPSLVTPRWLSFLMALHRELALRIHSDIKKGPFVAIN